MDFLIVIVSVLILILWIPAANYLGKEKTYDENWKD